MFYNDQISTKKTINIHRHPRSSSHIHELSINERKLEKLVDTYIWRKCKPRFAASSFERSLYFHKARKLCMEIKREHPSWGYRRIATELNRRLPVRIGRSTV